MRVSAWKHWSRKCLYIRFTIWFTILIAISLFCSKSTYPILFPITYVLCEYPPVFWAALGKGKRRLEEGWYAHIRGLLLTMLGSGFLWESFNVGAILFFVFLLGGYLTVDAGAVCHLEPWPPTRPPRERRSTIKLKVPHWRPGLRPKWIPI